MQASLSILLLLTVILDPPFLGTAADLNEAIVGLKITPMVFYAAVGTSVNFTVSWRQGTHFRWQVGIPNPDGTVDFSQFYDWPATTLTWTFTKVGSYFPFITASNTVSSQGRTPIPGCCPVVVQYPVLPQTYRLILTPTVKKLVYALRDDDIGHATTIAQIWVDSASQRPTSPSYSIAFDDNDQTDDAPLMCSEEIGSVTDGSWRLCMEMQHTYQGAASFTVTFVASNLVSSQAFSTTFASYAPIKSLNIFADYTENEDRPKWIRGYPRLDPVVGRKSYSLSFFPSGKLLRFTAGTEAFEGLQFCFSTSSDGPVTNCSQTWAVSENVFLKKFDYDTPCEDTIDVLCGLTVTVVAANPVDTASASITVYLQKPTLNLKLLEFGPAAKGDQFPLYFAFDQLGTDICLEVNYGTDKLEGSTSETAIFGSEFMCAENHTQSEMRTIRKFSETEIGNKAVRLPVQYSEAGRYQVAIKVYNFIDAVNSATRPDLVLAREIEVTGDGCFPRTFIHPVSPRAFKKDVLTVSGQVIVECPYVPEVEVTWTVLFRTEKTFAWKETGKNLSTSSNVMTYVTEGSKDVPLVFPGKTLAYGFYKCLLEAKMIDENGQIMTSSRSVELEVVKSDLAVCVSPQDSFRNVVFKDTVTMNAYQYAFDPDIGEPDGPKDGIQVHYYCKRECDGPWPNLSNLAEVQSFIVDPSGFPAKYPYFKWRTCSSGGDEGLKAEGYEKSGCFINGFHLKRSDDQSFSWGFPSLDPANFTRHLQKPLCGKNCEVTLSSVDSETHTLSIASKYQFENETYNLMAIIAKDTRYTIVQQSYRLERNPPETHPEPTRSLGDCLAAYKGHEKNSSPTRDELANKTVPFNGRGVEVKDCGSFSTASAIPYAMFFFISMMNLVF